MRKRLCVVDHLEKLGFEVAKDEYRKKKNTFECCWDKSAGR